MPLFLLRQELLPGLLDSPALELVSLALLGAYLVWSGLSMWRCAANVDGWGWRLAAPLAGLATILWGLVLVATAVCVCLGRLGLAVGWPL